MAVESTTVHGVTVWRDAVLTHRWYDAVGPGAQKWQLMHTDVVSTTTAAGNIVTSTNGTLVATDSTTGGAVTLTVGGADDDICTVQGHSEAFRFTANWPTYYGCKFQLVDADQTDFFAGICIKDTTLEAGMTDGVYFRLVDQSAVLSLVLEKDSAETTSEIATLADATDYTLEMYIVDGYVHAYLNGVLVVSVATSNANFPNDEDLCGTIGIQAGEGAANNCKLYWSRAIQIQQP